MSNNDALMAAIERLVSLEARVSRLELMELPLAIDSDTYNDSVAKILGTDADGGVRVDHLETGNRTGATEGEVRAATNVRADGFFYVGPISTLTIASGVVTATGSYHIIASEGGASTADDLDTINGGANGALLILRSAATAADITLKDATGNLALAGDFTLSTTEDRIVLVQHSSWWCELCRSDNS